MYFAMDMGTTNTRVWLCEKKQIIDSRKEPFGARNRKLNGKADLFERLRNLLCGLLQANGLSEADIECIITSGMSGSEIGILEVLHEELPMDVYRESTRLHVASIPEITNIPFWFVPGLKKLCGETLSDIMRGEETEVFGILPYLPNTESAVIVLPGTHNKIIRVNKQGEITDFQTTMSGEILDITVTQSILSGSVSHRFAISEADVLKGAAYADTYGLHAALFRVRVMEKNGISSDLLSSFLCGAVIGEDVKTIRRYVGTDTVWIGGNQALQSIYRILLHDLPTVALTREVADAAVVSGLQNLYAIHKMLRKRERVLKTIGEEKLISIVRAPEFESLFPAAQALYAGGVRLLEITFDRSGTISKEEICQMIAMLTDAFGDRMLIGAGTVTSPDEVKLAFDAGASFIISPNCDPAVIECTKSLGMVSIPAAYTATEIATALKHGADYIKLFPADGVTREYIRAIRAPLSDAKLLAVGGVTSENAKSFLDIGFCGVGVGSNLYDKKLIESRDFEALKQLAQKYAKAIRGEAPASPSPPKNKV